MSKYLLILLVIFFNKILFSQSIKESNQNSEYYISQLERKIELLSDSLENSQSNISKVITNRYYTRFLEREYLLKKRLIKLFIGHTTFIGGVVLVTITGLVVPIFMGVAAVEIFLIFEDKEFISL
jgi:hypothetical protein